jgi:hypothetical protein
MRSRLRDGTARRTAPGRRFPAVGLAVASLCAVTLITGCGSSGGRSSVGALPSAGGSATATAPAAGLDPDVAKLRSTVDALGNDTSIATTQTQLSTAVDSLRTLRTQSQSDLMAFYAYNKTTGKDCAIVRTKAGAVASTAATANSTGATIDGLVSKLQGLLAARQAALANANKTLTALSAKQLDQNSADALSGLRTALGGFSASAGATQGVLDSSVANRKSLPAQVQAHADRAAQLAGNCRH